MIRELNCNELAEVSGGVVTEVYPTPIPGYELIGWTEEIIGYDTNVWTVYKNIWDTVEYQQITPIYQINPIYAPIPATIYYI